jgi:MEMO1 family protein
MDTRINSTVRMPAFADVLYPNNAQALINMVEQYAARAAPSIPTFNKADLNPIIGLISPHIDYARGWQTYATVCKLLEAVIRPDVIFLFGTAHQFGRGLFHLTHKNFFTPLCTFPIAHEVVYEISSAYGVMRSFQGTHLHDNEHSLELQLPFLAYRFYQEDLPELVPILVGSFHESIMTKLLPETYGEIGEFIDILSHVVIKLRNSGKKILFYGGVDLAHVGLHFGDKVNMSNNGLDELYAKDAYFLSKALDSDLSLLFDHVASDCDMRRLCGFPSIYLMLSVMKKANIKTTGMLIDYKQSIEPKTDCVVTFASACWRDCA